MKLLCRLFGHSLPERIHNIYSMSGKWKDKDGNHILYRAHICTRCGKRFPVTPEDAAEKARKTAEISAIMNEARSHYGLPTINWDD